ncbi:MAG: hypothetical protein ACFFDW_01050 [Candidatus Thorarchaeota archaeon]
MEFDIEPLIWFDDNDKKTIAFYQDFPKKWEMIDIYNHLMDYFEDMNRQAEEHFAQESGQKLEDSDIKIEKITAERVYFLQEFIFYYAQFEAFLKDLLTMLFYQKPELISNEDKNKHFTIEDVLSNREDPISLIVYKKLYSWKSLIEYFEVFEKKLNFKFKKTNEFENYLFIMQQFRHCIVHNGGRISRDFLERVPTIIDLKLNQLVPIDMNYNRRFLEFIRYTSYNLVIQLISKFFSDEWNSFMNEVNNYVKEEIQ